MKQLLNMHIEATRDPNDIIYTPRYATELITPYLHGTVWECASGDGHMAEVLREHVDEVIETDITMGFDFLIDYPDPDLKIDFIVTNPPYTLKDKFLERCFQLGIPFALLLPLTALGGLKRITLYQKYGLEVLIPNRRINFIYPGAGDANWFHSAWFCYDVLPESLMFVDMIRA